MQLKKTKLLFIVALITLIPFVTGADALSYAVDIYRIPQTVNVGDEATIYVTVMNPVAGEEIVEGTYLEYKVNGIRYADIYPEQSLPAQMQTLTWTISLFEENDYVGYKVHLDFLYANSYESDWMYFREGEETTTDPLPKPPREPLTRMQIIYIACGVVVGVAFIAVAIVLINRRR